MDVVKLYEAVADLIRKDFCRYMEYEYYSWFRISESARVCNVNDQFRSVEDMYEVLKYQINPDIVREWYDLKLQAEYEWTIYSHWYNHPTRLVPLPWQNINE